MPEARALEASRCDISVWTNSNDTTESTSRNGGRCLYHCQRTVYKCADPKVSDFGFTIEAQQDIGWLDVSVYLHARLCWPGNAYFCWFY